MSIKVREYTDLNEILNLSYFNFSTVLMSNKIWLEEWWNTFKTIETNRIGKNKKLHVIVVFENDNFLVFPLVTLTINIKGFPVRFLELLSQQWGGYEAEILSNTNNTQKLIEEAFKYIDKNIKYDICFLKYLLENSCLNKANSFFAYAIVPYILISDYANFQEYKKKIYTKHIHRNLKSMYSKCKSENIDIQIVTEDFNDENFEEIKNISKCKLEDGKSYVYGLEENAKFYKNVFKRLKAFVIFIKFNSIPVAYRINVILKNKKHVIDASYDRNYRKLNLGIQSINSNIEDSFNTKIQLHSMGPGNDDYKFKYTDHVEYLYSFIKRGNTLISFLLFPIFKIFVKKKHDFVIKNTHQLLKK